MRRVLPARHPCQEEVGVEPFRPPLRRDPMREIGQAIAAKDQVLFFNDLAPLDISRIQRGMILVLERLRLIAFQHRVDTRMTG